MKIQKLNEIKFINQNRQVYKKGNSKLQRNTANSIYKLKLANIKKSILRMIRQRNQNKIKQDKINNPKQQKKPLKVKKYAQETDAQQVQNKISVIPTIIIAPTKPKPSLPKFSFQSNPKDQVEEYQDQIIEYLKELQQKYKVDQNYIKFHKSLTVKIRNFLVKYIFKMIWKYRCKRKTLYLTIYCLDLYLSKNSNIQSNNQTIAIAQASLNIAMKFEEIYPPQLKQWTTDACQIKKILQIEAEILKTIDFKLNLPSIVYFEQYFQKKFCQSDRYLQNKQNLYIEEQKIQLITDLCLFDVGLYEFKPHDLAKNIRRLVYNIDIPFNQERIALNVKWVMERNKEYMEWLKQSKYKELQNL